VRSKEKPELLGTGATGHQRAVTFGGKREPKSNLRKNVTF